MRRQLAPLVRSVRVVRGLEHPGRDGRHPCRPSGGASPERASAPPPPAPPPSRRSVPSAAPRPRAWRAGSASWTASWAGDSSPARSSCSVVTPASARARFSCSWPGGSPRAGHAALYLTGEESTSQVRGRAERVGAVVDGVGLVATTDLATAVGAIEATMPALAVVDSVQTFASAELGGPAGQRGAGPRGGHPPGRGGEGGHHLRRAGGPRDQGGNGGGAAHPRAPGRRRDLPRGRADGHDAPAAGRQEPIRLDRRGRGARDAQRRPGRGGRRQPLLPRVRAAAGGRQRDHHHARGDAPAGGRDPGPRRAGRVRIALAAPPPGSTSTGS